jgi:hypothetical protein
MPGTVTVACKIPNGLMIRTFVNETYDEPVMAGGTKVVTRSRPEGWSHKLNGPARAIGKDVNYQIVHGAGITHGVDADKFALWLEQNKDADYVVKGLVFAQVKADAVITQAYEHRNEKSGGEAVDPQNLPPEFKRTITTANAA